jgi:hypothetical protein
MEDTSLFVVIVILLCTSTQNSKMLVSVRVMNLSGLQLELHQHHKMPTLLRVITEQLRSSRTSESIELLKLTFRMKESSVEGY